MMISRNVLLLAALAGSENPVALPTGPTTSRELDALPAPDLPESPVTF